MLRFQAILNKKYLLGIVKTAAISTALYFFIRWLGGYGVLGFILIVLGVSAFKLWIARDYFLKKIREIEIIIWGKTNDRKK